MSVTKVEPIAKMQEETTKKPLKDIQKEEIEILDDIEAKDMTIGDFKAEAHDFGIG